MSRLLHAAGLVPATADVDEVGDAYNPRGLWEARSLVALNEKLLAAVGARWDSAPFLPPTWWRELEVDAWCGQIESLAREAGRDGDWAWKDPRLAVTLPLYLRALTESSCIVWVVRHPVAVARSLQRRNHFPLPLGLAIWALSNAHVAIGLEEFAVPAVAVHYEELVADPDRAFRSLIDRLKEMGITRLGSSVQASQHVDPGLQHETGESGSAGESALIEGLCRSVYTMACGVTTGEDAREVLRTIARYMVAERRELAAAFAVEALLREANRLRPLAVGYERLAGHPLVRAARAIKRLVRWRK